MTNTGICWLEIFWEMLWHCMDYPWHSQKWQCSTFPKLGTSQIPSTWFRNFIFLKTASAYALRQHSSCQSFGPKSSHDFMSGDFVENVRQVLESLSIILRCTTQAAKTSAQNFGPKLRPWFSVWRFCRKCSAGARNPVHNSQMHHQSCQKFSPKLRPKASAQNSGHDFLSGDFVENVQQVLEILSIILKCTIWAAKNSAQRFGHDFLSGDFVENVRQVLESLSIILWCTTQAAKTSAQNFGPKLRPWFSVWRFCRKCSAGARNPVHNSQMHHLSCQKFSPKVRPWFSVWRFCRKCSAGARKPVNNPPMHHPGCQNFGPKLQPWFSVQRFCRKCLAGARNPVHNSQMHHL